MRLAAYFSPEPTLQMFRCDVAQERATPSPASCSPNWPARRDRSSLADRRAAAAAIFTDPRIGRLPRTLVNRVWQRLLGRGIVGTVDEMDGEPWSPALLDWLASDFVAHGYDVKHLIETIVTSRAYQMPACARGRAAGARLRVPRPRGPAADGRAVRRRHRSRSPASGASTPLRRPAPAAPQRDPAAPPPSQPAAGQRPGARMARAVDHADARARPADPRSGHLHARRRRDDAAGARADQRRDAPAVAGARRARMLGELPPDPVSLSTPRRSPAATRRRARSTSTSRRRDAAVAGRPGHRIERARRDPAVWAATLERRPGRRDTTADLTPVDEPACATARAAR